MAACGCSIRLDPSHPWAWPKAGPQGVRTEPPQRPAQPQQFRQFSAQFAQKTKVGGIPAVRERKTPDTIRAEASTRVSRLQAAINSLGDGDAEAKKVLESSLAKAQKQVEIPHTRQIEESREFIARARKRILHADEKICLAEQTVAEAKEEKEYNLRVGRVPFGASAGRGTSPCIVPSSSTAVRLGSSDLISDGTGEPAPSRERLFRSDVVTTARCARGGDASEEIPRRRFRARLCGRVGRVDGLSSTGNEQCSCFWERFRCHQAGCDFGGRSNAVATMDPAPVCRDEHGPLSARKHQNSRVVHARYGLRGVRVGEANNPGPRRHRHRFASSSEDDFLVRPIEGRDVFPRVDGSSVTVPLTEVDSIVSPTVSPVPNTGALRQTLVDH